MEPLNLDDPAPPTTGRSANAERMLNAARKVMAMPDPWEKHRLDEVLFSARSLSFARRRNPPERGALVQLPEELFVRELFIDILDILDILAWSSLCIHPTGEHGRT